MTLLKQKLKELDACQEAMEWVGERTIEQAVNDCHRGDWLLWLGQRLEIDGRKITLAKGHCANTVRHLMKDQRSVDAVDVAIAYGEGKIGKEELAAAAAAYNAYAASHDITAKEENQKQTADICRIFIGQLIIEKFNEL
jgi:hypothetical protein